MALIELNLVDGDWFNADHVNMVEAAINTACNAGDVKMSISPVADLGWLTIAGQQVPNAQSLYPALWAKAPAEWKVGAALQFPNATQRFPIGAGTTPVGTAGGANTTTIGGVNLPKHTHDNAHDHPQAALTGDTGPAIDPEYRAKWYHKHIPAESGAAFVTDGNPDGHPGAGINATGSGYVLRPSTGSDTSDHIHQLAGNVDIPPLAGNTGDGGFANTPLDITPAWFAVYFMIKAH